MNITAHAIADSGSAEGLIELSTLLNGLFGGSSSLLAGL